MSTFLRSVIIALVFILAGCSKPPAATSAPQEVNAAKVGAILLLSNVNALASCEQKLTSAGAKILYRNQNGMLMVDRKASEIDPEGCPGIITPNVPLNVLPANTRKTANSAPPQDLPTLLKLIPAEEIGARSFIKAHPEYDGRGVRVAILDTGVEIDHPMLRTTSDGQTKVIDFEDFSGEGRVELKSVSDIAGIQGTEFKQGVFEGSSLKNYEDLAGVDKFKDLGVISYLNAAGQRRARIDLDDDKDFSNDLELYNYAESRLFVKLGEKKTLTVSMNVAADGSAVTLRFDDGTHGTHVAGIATGFDPQGLSGVAPGAQVIAVKIGDNRLSGGSTTTASMLLAIDYAVAKKAQVANLSYGIRSGSNLGKSLIDKYIDKVALETGMLFSISAGNEGPGLLSIGTPAAADLAFSNAAYVSKQTAQESYGYLGVEDDNTWYFSSVGPRLDGGWKPSLLAPGSAVSSLPPWIKSYQNYRGTSMASPHVTGGLALLVGSALKEGLPSDRPSITRAVYQSAKRLSNLMLIEQGHGLMSIPGAYEYLKNASTSLPIEYSLSVTSPTSPTGKGEGIYVRSGKIPVNNFAVSVTPRFPLGTSAAVQDEIHTFRLESSAPWIKTGSSFWLGSFARTFQVGIDATVLAKQGAQSELLKAIDEKTGLVAFEVPVTFIVPSVLSESNNYTLDLSPTIRVGQTLRYFIEVPGGATSAWLDLSSDGPLIWGMLQDPEGRSVLNLQDMDTSTPMADLKGQANLKRSGVYELDLIAPPTNARPANLKVRVRTFGLSVKLGASLGADRRELTVENLFAALKVIPKVEVQSRVQRSVAHVTGDKSEQAVDISDTDLEQYSSVSFNVETAKVFYDRMTDYPFCVFDSKGGLLQAGGLELSSQIEIPLEEMKADTLKLLIQGAFTDVKVEPWSYTLTERRILAQPRRLLTGVKTLIEKGQEVSWTLDMQGQIQLQQLPQSENSLVDCATLILDSVEGRLVQSTELCN